MGTGWVFGIESVHPVDPLPRDGFVRWAPVLAGMKQQEFSQGRMSRETGLSYNTVKTLGRTVARLLPRGLPPSG